MRQPGLVLDVGPGETTAQLLEQLNTVPPGTHILLRLPRDAKALRELDDFNNLRQIAADRQLQLMVSCPEKTIVGLARLLGFEVDSKPGGADTGAAVSAAPASPAHNGGRGGGPAAGSTPRSTAPTARPGSMPAAAAPVSPIVPLAPVAPPPPAASPAPATPMSENDWLFGTGTEAVPDTHVEAAGGLGTRQPTPPLDVHIVGGSAPTGAPRPPAGDTGFDDIDAMNFDDAELERQSAQYREEIATNTAGRTPEQAGEAEIAALQARLEASARATPKTSRTTNGAGGMLGGLLGSRKPARTPPPARPAASRPPPAARPTSGPPAAVVTPAPPLPHSLLDDTPVAPQPDVAVAIPLPVPAPRPVVVPRTGPITRQRPVAARRGAGLWVVLALVALLGLLLAAAWGVLTFLPQATVAVIPGTQVVLHPVEVPVSTIGTSLSSGGGRAAPAIQPAAQVTDTTALQVPPLTSAPLTAAPVTAQRFTANLSEEATVPTTGSREQPAGKDKITLALVNPSGSRAVLSAGTDVSGGGVTFRLTQDVAVAGATDTGTALVYGQGSAEAEAVEVGPHTVGVGAVAGTFGNGVRYRNTTSAEGGYMEQIATVAQADVDKLRADLFSRLQSQINGAILAQVPAELQAIPPTLSVPDTNWKEELNHAVGDDATDLHMKMSVSGSIAAYNPNDVEQAVKSVVAAEGAPRDPLSDPQLDKTSIEYGPLEMVGAPAGDQITYRTVTTATVFYNITPEMQQQIRTLVRGKTVDAARQAVLTDPDLGKYISDIRITSGLSGLLNLSQDRVPDDPARIKVEAAADQP